jgi:hypothetical protein
VVTLVAESHFVTADGAGKEAFNGSHQCFAKRWPPLLHPVLKEAEGGIDEEGVEVVDFFEEAFVYGAACRVRSRRLARNKAR